MSLLDKASLVVTPNAVKSGKLYSIVPSSGAGDMDVVRATTATRVNSLGLIENVGLNVARLNYDTIGGCPSILIEPQRTNTFLSSEPIANEGLSSNITYLPYNWLIGFINSIVFGNNLILRYRYGATATNLVVNTISCYVIMDDLSQPIVGTNTTSGDFSLVIAGTQNTGINGSLKYENLGNNIWRISANHNVTSGTLTNNGIIKFTGQSSKSFKVVGWQLEAGSSVTSYIPTVASIQTRNADVITVSPPLGTVKITTTFSNDTTEIITTIPATYTAPIGKLKLILMQHTI